MHNLYLHKNIILTLQEQDSDYYKDKYEATAHFDEEEQDNAPSPTSNQASPGLPVGLCGDIMNFS